MYSCNFLELDSGGFSKNNGHKNNLMMKNIGNENLDFYTIPSIFLKTLIRCNLN